MSVLSVGRAHANPETLKIRLQKYTEVLREPNTVDDNYKELQEHLECFVDPIIQGKPKECFRRSRHLELSLTGGFQNF